MYVDYKNSSNWQATSNHVMDRLLVIGSRTWKTVSKVLKIVLKHMQRNKTENLSESLFVFTTIRGASKSESNRRVRKLKMDRKRRLLHLKWSNRDLISIPVLWPVEVSTDEMKPSV